MLCIICIKKVEAEIRKMNNFMNGESFFKNKLIKKVKKKNLVGKKIIVKIEYGWKTITEAKEK